ncbi:hypothetical protein FRC04_004236 [Tulasnella sp. 424]|nr:hypothetical protein FRC04_004236 [Tulasnella sp. 424]KAG8979363.1 hypothetical protein FRC05_008347 [Tulasnella sp. 425]
MAPRGVPPAQNTSTQLARSSSRPKGSSNTTSQDLHVPSVTSSRLGPTPARKPDSGVATTLPQKSRIPSCALNGTPTSQPLATGTPSTSGADNSTLVPASGNQDNVLPTNSLSQCLHELEQLKEVRRQEQEIYRKKIERLILEREQLKAALSNRDANSSTAQVPQNKTRRTRDVAVSTELDGSSGSTVEDVRQWKDMYEAERAQRMKVELERDTVLADKLELERKIPAVIELCQQLEAIAAKTAAQRE